jgi:hypothetical protein
MAAIPEKFIRHLWRNLHLKWDNLQTVDGRPLRILSVGTLNAHAGADFQNAKIDIGGQVLTGAVEIHTKTSDWTRHGHDANPRYAGVVLHAVFDHDTESPNAVPVFEMRKFLNDELHKVIARCIADEKEFAKADVLHCSFAVTKFSDDEKFQWLDKLSSERFAAKQQQFAGKLDASLPLEQACDNLIYDGLARALGYSENTAAMETLARKTPLAELQAAFGSLTISERRQNLEAVYFSIANFAGNAADAETTAYKATLGKAFQASPFRTTEKMNALDWQFFRMRPPNFPTVRVAGLAEIVSKNLGVGFLKNILDVLDMGVPARRKIFFLESLFRADADGYWKTHYRFGESAKTQLGQLVGKTRASEIVINIVLPVVALYAERTQNEKASRRISDLYAKYPKGLTSVASEKTLTELFGDGYAVKSASMEQALLHLKKTYCDLYRCLACDLGKKIFQTG